MSNWKIYNQNILKWCNEYRGERFHAMLGDGPYGIQFMGNEWDKEDNVVFKSETWSAISEHLHDGAFGFAFSSSRTYHRLGVAIEDAGLVLHSSIFGWGFGSGFPKATRIDKQVDEIQGIEVKRGKARPGYGPRTVGYRSEEFANNVHEKDAHYDPQSDLAKAWTNHRYGLQALKPALEPILLFQKPYSGKPVECIMRTGSGALNISAARVGTELQQEQKRGQSKLVYGTYDDKYTTPERNGRWPSNLILVHHPECEFIGLVKTQGRKGGYVYPDKEHKVRGFIADFSSDVPCGFGSETVERWLCIEGCPVSLINSIGTNYHNNGADRYFYNSDWSLEIQEQIDLADTVYYCPKVSTEERNAGLDHLEDKILHRVNSGGLGNDKKFAPVISKNPHPTVKPIKLTRYLSKLLLPPNIYQSRRMLVPFSGVGSEMIGALLAGYEEIVGVEKDTEEGYVDIADARLSYWSKYKEKFGHTEELKPVKDVDTSTLFQFMNQGQEIPEIISESILSKEEIYEDSKQTDLFNFFDE